MGYISPARFRCFISVLNYVGSQQTQSARKMITFAVRQGHSDIFLNTDSLKNAQVNDTNFTIFLKDDVVKVV